MRTSIAVLSSVLLVLIVSALIMFGYENSSVKAQETIQSSTAATYNIESKDPDALEDNAEGASDSAIELIEETIEGPLTKNTTESARTEVTTEFSTLTENFTGITETKDYLRIQLDGLIDLVKRNSTSLTFKIKIDTECKPPNVDCLFRIHLQK